MLPFGAQAQLLTNNGAVITSTFGSAVIVNGGVLNQGATGILDNNGSLMITGDFTHNAPNSCFGASQGEVSLNGGAQTIGGNNVAVFNDLSLDGTGTKTLLQDVEVGGAHASPAGTLFLNGRTLDLGTHQLTIRNPAPSAINRTTGFIVSETDPNAGYSFVRWNIGDAPVNAYTIPFGNAATGEYLPFTATILAPGVGVSGYVRMATYPTITLANPNNRPLPTGMVNLIDVSGAENAPNVLDRWWIMESEGYTSAPVATTQFTYRDNEWSTGTNTIVESTLQLERRVNTWTMMSTVANTTANTLTTIGQPLITSTWTAAELGSPLPVELLSFTGERMNDREVMLRWSTATESNNAGFEVWRMLEGEETFAEVGWVDGVGNSQTLSSYELADDNASDRTSYYKLKQVDNNGVSEWSDVLSVAGTRHAAEIVAYPNPARDRLMLTGPLTDVERIDLVDAGGRAVRSWGRTMLLDGLDDLERGMYMVIASHIGGGSSIVRVILE